MLSIDNMEFQPKLQISLCNIGLTYYESSKNEVEVIFIIRNMYKFTESIPDNKAVHISSCKCFTKSKQLFNKYVQCSKATINH